MAKLRYRFGFLMRPKAPYDFGLTVHKPAGWSLFSNSEIYEKGTLWTALHIDGKLVGLKLRSRGTARKPLILAEAFIRGTPTKAQKNSIKEAIASKLYIGQDLNGFYRMARKDGILKHTIPDLYGMHDTDPSDLYSTAILAICLQMAPLKRSQQMMDCLIRQYGGVAEFDGKKIRAWPAPRKMAGVNARELARRCKLGYRAKYIVQMARVLEKKGSPTLEGLKLLPPEEAKEKLLELPGIGDYSADIISPHGGFPIDVWSAEVFGKLFFKRRVAGRDSIEKVKAEGIRRWGRCSWMAFYYVVQDLENLSKKLGVSLRLQ